MTDLPPATTPPLFGRWIEKRYAPILCGLVALAALTRAALVYGSPRPFGYVWDLYHEGVVLTYERARLPFPNECWECYAPPLYFACGAPLYALGAALAKGDAAGGLRVLSLFSMVCAAFVVYFCHKTLRLLRPARGTLLLGAALALVFPCLFIASYGAENDALLAALMTAFFHLLCRRHLHPAGFRPRDAALMGVLAGLSALTKYSGLLAPAAAAVALGSDFVFGRRRARAARGLLIVAGAAAAVSGWHYAANLRTAGRLFRAPPGYSGPSAGAPRGRAYDFASFRVQEVADLYRPKNAGALNDFPVYGSVFSALHALAWTDMSFFSVPSRHGWRVPADYAEGGGKLRLVAETPAGEARVPPYPAKDIPPALVALVLRLAVVPSLLALAGLAATLRRRALRPFLVFAGISVSAYVRWFLAQPAWGLKTKYVLFLLPVYIVYCLLGLRAAARLDRRLGLMAGAGLIAALLAAEAYLWVFALA